MLYYVFVSITCNPMHDCSSPVVRSTMTTLVSLCPPWVNPLIIILNFSRIGNPDPQHFHCINWKHVFRSTINKYSIQPLLICANPTMNKWWFWGMSLSKRSLSKNVILVVYTSSNSCNNFRGSFEEVQDEVVFFLLSHQCYNIKFLCHYLRT